MVTRIISAVVGIAVAIGILFLSATPVFNLAVSAITCLLIYEILSACECLKYKFHSAVCFGFAAVMPFLVEYVDREYLYMVATFCILLFFIGYIAKHKDINFEKDFMVWIFTKGYNVQQFFKNEPTLESLFLKLTQFAWKKTQL